MRLYAIRDRETGHFVRIVSPCGYITNEEEILAWYETALPALKDEFGDNGFLERITLRIEPTEPCECCYFMSRKGWEFCGECGRRLRDE